MWGAGLVGCAREAPPVRLFDGVVVDGDMGTALKTRMSPIVVTWLMNWGGAEGAPLGWGVSSCLGPNMASCAADNGLVSIGADNP